jgi:gamma-glutamyltranspeptidase/glutathione hydrolase
MRQRLARALAASLLALSLPLSSPAFAQAGPVKGFDGLRGDRSHGWIGQTRSEVLGQRGVVATSHPLAAQAGLDILKKGGNAFDAAVAAGAVLNVVEPESAGMGGDVLVLAWIAKEKKLVGLNGVGRAVTGSTPQRYAALGHTNRIPVRGIHSVTTPGAVDGWDALLKRAGTMTFKEVLEPAARIAENGFGVSERVHGDWNDHLATLRSDPETARVYLPGGEPPPLYSVFRNPDLGKAFRLLQTGGRDAFYKGPIAEAMVARSQALGGGMTMADLARTEASWVTPISTTYRGHEVYQLPPSTQGFAVLQMLNILEACAPRLGVDLKAQGHRSPLYWHLLVEAKKIAFEDVYRYNGDPDFSRIDVARLSSKAYAATRCADIDMKKARTPDAAVDPIGGTVYVAVADAEGNMVSFIYSIYGYFASGVTVPNYGFVLNNRAAFFSLDPKSPNIVAPGKRPFHTLIPGLIMKDGQPQTVFGLMGGTQQAQGHMQVLVDMLDLGANPQAASDAARFSHVQSTNTLFLESELFKTIGPALQALGHKVELGNAKIMGGFQAVTRPRLGEPTLAGASDHRKDGLAVAW